MTYSSNLDNNTLNCYNNQANHNAYGCIGQSNNNNNNNRNKHGSYEKKQKGHKPIANSYSDNIYNNDMYLNSETMKQNSGRITKTTTKYINSENPNTSNNSNNSMVKKLRIEINRIQIMYS